MAMTSLKLTKKEQKIAIDGKSEEKKAFNED